MPQSSDELFDPPGTPSANEDDSRDSAISLTPREAVAIIRRRWPVVLAVFTVVVAFGGWRTWRQPRVYESTATVRFQQTAPPVQGMGQQMPMRSFGVDPLQSEQLLIKSQSVAERVARRAGIRLRIAGQARSRREVFGDSVPYVDDGARNGEYRLTFRERDYALSSGGTEFGSAPYGTRLTTAGLSLFVPQRPAFKESSILLLVSPLHEAAGIVRGGLLTRAIPQTDVVEITYRGLDPVIVRDVANATALSYAEFSSEMAKTSASSKTQFIESSLDEQKSQLAAAQLQLQAFKERNQTSDVSAEIAALFENIHRFEGERRSALIEKTVYQQLLGKLTQADTIDEDLRKLAGTEAITKNAYIANLYTRWFELLKDREELLAGGRSPEHLDVLSMDKLITRTKEDLQAASRHYLEGVESRLASYDQTIAELRRQGERYPPMESEQARLMADVRTMERMYADLQSQYQLARIAESADGATVRIVDEAPLPAFAVAPNRKRALAFAVLVGLALGIGLALLIEKLDDSVKSPDELLTRFQLPVLGQIPAIRASERGTNAAPLNRLVSHFDPRSVVAEAYRSLRTNLAFARARSKVRTLVLTSPGPADGKSTTVANLATTFAQQGQRTLLIDGDLRRAVLDKTFSIPRSPGLTELIVGAAVLDDAVHPTTVENLFVMGSGQLPPNPSELLGSDRMREVLAEVREQFDIVLFDSPPLLAVTDAAVLSTIVDGAILVVRTGSTTRQAVRRAAAHLRAVHARVLGAVLNDIDVKSGSYYGGYGYYYYAYQSNETPGAGSNGDGNGTGMMGRLRKLTGQGAKGGQ